MDELKIKRHQIAAKTYRGVELVPIEKYLLFSIGITLPMGFRVVTTFYFSSSIIFFLFLNYFSLLAVV